jgi:mannosyltransferase OCH1-like enzyme
MKYIKYICIIIILCTLYIISYDIGTSETKVNEDSMFEMPRFIPRKVNNQTDIVSSVPLTIYQHWHTTMLPQKMKECVYKLIDMNPEFDYYLYDDKESLSFIKDNFDDDVIDAFNVLKPSAYKSDLWRYCILYTRGGVYLDIKIYSLKPLLPIIKENPNIWVKDGNNDTCNNIGICNGFLVSPPKNPVFKECIDEIVKNCRLRVLGDSPLSVTGPCLLGKIIAGQYGISYIENISFKLKWKGKEYIYIQYEDEQILRSYIQYRSEQKKTQNDNHYLVLWAKGDIYNY